MPKAEAAGRSVPQRYRSCPGPRSPGFGSSRPSPSGRFGLRLAPSPITRPIIGITTREMRATIIKPTIARPKRAVLSTLQKPPGSAPAISMVPHDALRTRGSITHRRQDPIRPPETPYPAAHRAAIRVSRGVPPKDDWLKAAVRRRAESDRRERADEARSAGLRAEAKPERARRPEGGATRLALRRRRAVVRPRRRPPPAKSPQNRSARRPRLLLPGGPLHRARCRSPG